MFGVMLMVSCGIFLTQSQEEMVASVIDGDTIILKGGERIRFARIDTPELNTRKGRKVANWLRNKIDGKKVLIVRKGKGFYGRTLGEVYFNGINLNDELLRTGRAVLYK